MTDIRYLTQAGTEYADECRSHIFEIITTQDKSVKLEKIYNSVDYSDRTIRSKIADSKLIERDSGHGVTFVYSKNQKAKRAIKITVSSQNQNNKNGLPDEDEQNEKIEDGEDDEDKLEDKSVETLFHEYNYHKSQIADIKNMYTKEVFSILQGDKNEE